MELFGTIPDCSLLCSVQFPTCVLMLFSDCLGYRETNIPLRCLLVMVSVVNNVNSAIGSDIHVCGLYHGTAVTIAT